MTLAPQPIARNPQQIARRAIQYIREQLANEYPKRASRPSLDSQEIKRAVEEYCRDPDGRWPVGLYTGDRLWPVMKVWRRVAEARQELERVKKPAQQTERALRKIRDALFERVEDKGPWLYGGKRWRWRPKPALQPFFSGLCERLADIEYLIKDAKLMQQRPKKGWPRKADMPARYHAALVAVRLFRHHALEPTASHSLNNKVLPLAKIIFGEPQSSTGETDKGWFQQINRAIKETSIRSRTATTINDADRRLSARQSRLFPKP